VKKNLFLAAGIAALALGGGQAFAGLSASGDAAISGMFDGSPLVIRSSSRFAGAIYSVTWKGMEFINSHDHGRLLQSASSFDGEGECFNPTEGGSTDDGVSQTSTSKLLAIYQGPGLLATNTQMAFWLKHGEKDGPHCTGAVNKTALSNHSLSKNVRIGFGGMPNVIEYIVAFQTPIDEHHTNAQFEALTGYMPGAFSRFWTYDGTTLADLAPSAGVTPTGIKRGGQQILPVITGTPDKRFAMGIYSPDLPQKGRHGGYGRAQFAMGSPNAVVKWNAVFHYEGAQVKPGQAYGFRLYVIIGSVNEVAASMKALMALSPH